MRKIRRKIELIFLLNFFQVENSVSVDLRCSDHDLYESVLRPDQFGSLPNLGSLSIQRCKVRNLPNGAFIGLRNLKKLVLQVMI